MTKRDLLELLEKLTIEEKLQLYIMLCDLPTVRKE